MTELSGIDDFEGRLIVGDIRRLNAFIEDRGSALVHGEVDLVSGGPPCQSFSLAGRREFGNQRNQLPWEFAKFVDVQRPRMVLLENVEGILRPFKLDSTTYYAWFEVCKAFANIGYATCPMLVNARFAGVAQNRPRFIMLAIREDLISSLSEDIAPWFAQGVRLIEAVKNADPVYDKNEWRYWDLTDETDASEAEGSVFAPLVTFRDPAKQHTVYDAIRDLQDVDAPARSRYVKELNSVLGDYLEGGNPEMQNLRHPNSTPKVQARFRVYQVIANSPKQVGDEIKKIMRGQKTDISDVTYQALLKRDLLEYGNGLPADHESMVDYLAGMKTRSGGRWSVPCPRRPPCQSRMTWPIIPNHARCRSGKWRASSRSRIRLSSEASPPQVVLVGGIRFPNTRRLATPCRRCWGVHWGRWSLRYWLRFRRQTPQDPRRAAEILLIHLEQDAVISPLAVRVEVSGEIQRHLIGFEQRPQQGGVRVLGVHHADVAEVFHAIDHFGGGSHPEGLGMLGAASPSAASSTMKRRSCACHRPDTPYQDDRHSH